MTKRVLWDKRKALRIGWSNRYKKCFIFAFNFSILLVLCFLGQVGICWDNVLEKHIFGTWTKVNVILVYMNYAIFPYASCYYILYMIQIMC